MTFPIFPPATTSCAHRSSGEQRLEEGLASSTGRLLHHLLLLALCRRLLETLLPPELLALECLCVRVEAEEHELVRERVLVLCPRTPLDLCAGGAHDGLDLGGVDEAGHVWVGDLCGGEANWGVVSVGRPLT